MNYQKEIPLLIIEQFSKEGLNLCSYEIRYYAFPYTFGSTCGPRKGIGGQAMSTFTVEAFESDFGTVYLCDGVMKFSPKPIEFIWPE